MTTEPASLAAEIDSAAIPCERCKFRSAVYLVVHGDKCEGGAAMAPPLSYTMCAHCLGLYGKMVAAGRVQCVACHKVMDKVTHAIKEIEHL